MHPSKSLEQKSDAWHFGNIWSTPIPRLTPSNNVDSRDNVPARYIPLGADNTPPLAIATEQSLSWQNGFGVIGAHRQAAAASLRSPANSRLYPTPTVNKAHVWNAFAPVFAPSRAIEQPPTVYTEFDRPQDLLRQDSAVSPWPGCLTPSMSDESRCDHTQPANNTLTERGPTLSRIKIGIRYHCADWAAEISPSSVSSPRGPITAAWSENPSHSAVLPQLHSLRLHDSNIAFNGSLQKANPHSQHLLSGAVPISMRNSNFNTPQNRTIHFPTTTPAVKDHLGREHPVSIYESRAKVNRTAYLSYQNLRIAGPRFINTDTTQPRNNFWYALPPNKPPVGSPFHDVSTPVFNGVDGYEETSLLDDMQSTLLYEFKTNVKRKPYGLRDIYGHVAEFSGDQRGSRFIQTKLENASLDEKEHVFQELQPNVLQLMTDVFGNHVVQKFFEHGDQNHKKALAQKMRGNVLTLSLQMYGCHVVQKALDHVLASQQRQIVSELEGNVLRCVTDRNGNHVVQKAIERCPSHTIRFIVESFRGRVAQLSVHPYGCRVIQRCLEHCDAASKALIMAELMDSIDELISDMYGNYIVQSIVSKVEGPDKQYVLQIVAHGLERFSKHKFASNVVEKCLEHADDCWRFEILRILFRDSHQKDESDRMLVGFLKDDYGNYVIKKLLETLCPRDYVAFVELLHPAVALAKQLGCGKQILSIEKKLHKYPQKQP